MLVLELERCAGHLEKGKVGPVVHPVEGVEGVGFETRGVADHHFINSIYFRDPNGYVIELTAKLENHDAEMDPATNGARGKLDDWQARKVA